MTHDVILAWESAQLVISVLGLALSIVIVHDAWCDRREAEHAGARDLVSSQAIDIAKERVVAGWFLLFMSTCLVLSSIYAVVLVDALTVASQMFGQEHVQIQAVWLRVVWRLGVTGFAFVRWSTRERIRRELKL